MIKPVIIDLCACRGGCTRGYQRAGFYVIAVDVVDYSAGHPADEFYVMDALAGLARFAHRAHAVRTSPPCQRYTHGNAGRAAADRHPDLIGAHRHALEALGLPYVIENVPRAPLVEAVTLCGTMFGLTTVDDDGTVLHLQRHRKFETSFPLDPPAPCRHPKGVQWAGAYGGARRDKWEARNVRHGGYVPPKHILPGLLGIDWIEDEHALFQAIPPAYTEHIGRTLRELL